MGDLGDPPPHPRPGRALKPAGLGGRPGPPLLGEAELGCAHLAALCPRVGGETDFGHSPRPRISPRRRLVRFALWWVPGPAPSRRGRVGGGEGGPGRPGIPEFVTRVVSGFHGSFEILPQEDVCLGGLRGSEPRAATRVCVCGCVCVYIDVCARARTRPGRREKEPASALSQLQRCDRVVRRRAWHPGLALTPASARRTPRRPS